MSDKVWFLGKGKKKIGPMTREKVMARMASGKIPRGALAWKEGMASWMPVAEIPELSDSNADTEIEAAPKATATAVKERKKKTKRTKRTKRSSREGRGGPPPVPAGAPEVEVEAEAEEPKAKKKKGRKTGKVAKAPKAKKKGAAKPKAAADAPAAPASPAQPVVPKALLGLLALVVAAVATCLALVKFEVIVLENLGAIGGVAGAIGFFCFLWGGMQAYKAGRIAKTPFVKTSEAADPDDAHAGDKKAISVEGRVTCDDLLISPVTGTPCLYYEVKVVGTWKEDDSTKSKEYESIRNGASFTVDDGSGPVLIDASEGGDFEPTEETFDETRKEGFLAGMVGTSQAMEFGNYSFHNPAGSKADAFRCTEKVMLPQDQLFVLGKADGGQIGSPNWASLILSNKTRDVLLGSTQKSARRSLTAGGVVVAIGSIVGMVFAFLG